MTTRNHLSDHLCQDVGALHLRFGLLELQNGVARLEQGLRDQAHFDIGT